MLAGQQDNNRSDFKSSAWKSQSSAWTLTSDFWRSPLYVREQREKYLEKFRKEPALKYDERLNRSVFTNEFRNTIETMAGMVFKVDPSPKEGVPPATKDLFTDIDGCGNSLHSFLIKAFEWFLRDGNVYIYVDSPPAPQTEEGQILTAKDREADRTFWVLYSASQLINHRYERIGGREVLSLAVLEEKTIEPDGLYGEMEVVRHRILKRGSYSVERFDKQTGEWVNEVPESATGLMDIPLVSVAEIGATPILLTLAMLNQQYYNKVSDFDSWCHIACVPRQVLKLGTMEDFAKYKELAVSPETGIKIGGEHADTFYLEPSGAGLEIAKERNGEIKAEMSAIGVGLLAPSEIAPKSATEVLDTAGQRQSKLARYAREFENAIEKALFLTAEQENVIRPNSVDMTQAEDSALKLTMDFDRLTFSPEQMMTFERMNASGKLSDLTFFELLQNVFDFPQGWTPEEEVRRKAAQRAAEPEPVTPPRTNGDAVVIG